MLFQNTKNPGIKEAIKELNLINASDRLRARYEARMKSKSDRDAEDAYVLEQGVKKGIEQERQQGIQIMIKTCKEFKLSQDDTVKRIMEEYQMSLETAKK